ncbi:unnamed protein product [Brassica oleracea]
MMVVCASIQISKLPPSITLQLELRTNKQRKILFVYDALFFANLLCSSITLLLFSAVLRCATTTPYIPDLYFRDHRLLLHLRRRSTETARQIPQRLSASVTPSLYEILEIPVGSTSQVIKSAYRRLARICHPDVAGNRRNYASSDAFMKIHAAYCTLSDPEKRAVYDRKILCGRRPLTVGVSRFGSYGGGNWETDQCW